MLQPEEFEEMGFMGGAEKGKIRFKTRPTSEKGTEVKAEKCSETNGKVIFSFKRFGGIGFSPEISLYIKALLLLTISPYYYIIIEKVN